METGQIGESADVDIPWAHELKWQAVLDQLSRQSGLSLLARHRDGEVERFEPTTELQGAWVATEELRCIFANPPREAIEEFERKRQQGVDEAAREEAARRAAGRYTMREAAKEIARNGRGDWRELLGRLKTSADSGALKVYRPGSIVSCKPSSPKRPPLHFHYMEATWRDLNTWLEENEQEITSQFPAPASATEQNTAASISEPQTRPGAAIPELIGASLPDSESGSPVASIATTPTADASQPNTVQAVPAALATPAIAAAFCELNGWDDQAWKKNLADPPAWLKKARIQKGSRKAGGAATWNPVTIALYLADKRVSLLKLDGVFKKAAMKAWASEWENKSAYLRD
ncbi:MAG: hypothetical protein C0465_23700 [Ralstonia sp.]|nr:hypothetical protein [Ralstonia sp.]MBA4238528.1 hypothetical protein [Ralstonia sp.]MBA4404488.1 hypothetical protein [Ralstonia sp.]POH87437.1 hypothetical protein CJ026_011320 [Ralstonia pickettii]